MCVCVCVWCSLPERIRPTVVAFGGVADGFVPFDTVTKGLRNQGAAGEGGGVGLGVGVELHLASIVMKAVQVTATPASNL